MDSGWVKHLVDGKTIDGGDREVQQGLASWSKSQNTNLAAVDLFWRGKKVRIEGPGDYWQSDDLISSTNCPLVLVRRRIERQIGLNDTVFGVRIDEHVVKAVVSHNVRKIDDPDVTQVQHLQPSDKGKWLTLEITDDPKMWFRVYLLDSRR